MPGRKVCVMPLALLATAATVPAPLLTGHAAGNRRPTTAPPVRSVPGPRLLPLHERVRVSMWLSVVFTAGKPFSWSSG